MHSWIWESRLLHAWDWYAEFHITHEWDRSTLREVRTGCVLLIQGVCKVVVLWATNCTISLFVWVFFRALHLYWHMYLLNLAFPFMSRWGRHVPSCRLVSDPSDPTCPVKIGLLTGLAPPVMPTGATLSTILQPPLNAAKHVWIKGRRTSILN